MIQEYERAVLIIDLPEHGLKAGDVGTDVHIYDDGVAYEEVLLAAAVGVDSLFVEASARAVYVGICENDFFHRSTTA